MGTLLFTFGILIVVGQLMATRHARTRRREAAGARTRPGSRPPRLRESFHEVTRKPPLTCGNASSGALTGFERPPILAPPWPPTSSGRTVVGDGNRLVDHLHDDRRDRHPRGARDTWSIGCSGIEHVFLPIGFILGGRVAASTSSGCGTGGERVTAPEPERALIRRVSPFAVPAALAGLRGRGALRWRVDAGWSAAIAIVHRLPELRRERAVHRVGGLDLADAREHRRARWVRGAVDRLHDRPGAA